MRIVILTGIFPPEVGGPAIYVKRLAEELSQRKFDVRVVTYANPVNPKSQIPNPKLQFKIQKISKKYPKFIRHLVYLFKVFGAAKNCDVIYAQNLFSVGIPGLIASKILRKKLVVKVVGDYAWEQSLQKGWFSGGIDDFQKAKSLKVNFLKNVQKKLALVPDAIITPSNYLKSIIKGWGVPGEKIKVIYNAPEDLPYLDLFQEDAQKKIGIRGNIILSAGRLAPWKGFSGLIAIMPDLLKENPNFCLVIVGEGPERQNLESRIKNLELEKRVKLIRGVPHSEMPLYFRAADLFALNTGYEGLSHIILEAMQAGLPIVTTNIGGNPELIENGKNGILIEYNNKKQLKEAILRLMADEHLQEKFKQNSKEKLRVFTWQNVVDKTLKVFGY